MTGQPKRITANVTGVGSSDGLGHSFIANQISSRNESKGLQAKYPAQ